MREDVATAMTSGKVGKVIPVAQIPLLRGDSASGNVTIQVELGEMDRPTLNAVVLNAQAWFVPKTCFPQFAGHDEFMASYNGTTIKAAGQPDRAPPPFFNVLTDAAKTALAESEVYKTLGLHVPAGPDGINTDLVDALALIYNFRLASFSSRLQRRKYSTEAGGLAEVGTLPPAFWPPSRMTRVVPDYERALVVGAFGLDVIAGTIKYSGHLPVQAHTVAANRGSQRVRKVADGQLLGHNGSNTASKTSQQVDNSVNTAGGNIAGGYYATASSAGNPLVQTYMDPGTSMIANVANLIGQFEGDSITVSLADIDKARTTQAFAKMRSAYAGNDTTGFDNEEMLVAELMQGMRPPENAFKRPWLLDSKMVPFNMPERHATDGDNLDMSVTQGRVAVNLRTVVPYQEASGYILVTIEVVPERLDERMSDEYIMATSVDHLPNALRDIQRPEPVDEVQNRRLDAKHTAPGAVYGFEPMNDKWNRQATRLGGAFYQATPGTGWTEQRSALYLAEIVDPTYTKDHFVVPVDFPQNVFKFSEQDAIETAVRWSVQIMGNTQIGDVLVENNDDYEAVQEA